MLTQKSEEKKSKYKNFNSKSDEKNQNIKMLTQNSEKKIYKRC